MLEVKAEPELTTLDAAATVLGVCRTTVRTLTRKGKIPYVQIGGRIMIPIAELRRIATEGTSKNV